MRGSSDEYDDDMSIYYGSGRNRNNNYVDLRKKYIEFVHKFAYDHNITYGRAISSASRKKQWMALKKKNGWVVGAKPRKVAKPRASSKSRKVVKKRVTQFPKLSAKMLAKIRLSHVSPPGTKARGLQQCIRRKKIKTGRNVSKSYVDKYYCPKNKACYKTLASKKKRCV